MIICFLKGCYKIHGKSFERCSKMVMPLVSLEVGLLLFFKTIFAFVHLHYYLFKDWNLWKNVVTGIFGDCLLLFLSAV